MGDRYFAEKVAKLNSPLNIICDNLLDEAEEFKSKFIREDEVIYSLRNDINSVGNSIRKNGEDEETETPFNKNKN